MVSYRWLSLALLWVFIGTLVAEDKIFQKGDGDPLVGTIIKAGDTAVQFQLPNGIVPIDRNRIDRVDIPQPAEVVQSIGQIEGGKISQGVAVLEPFYEKYKGLPQPWIEQMTVVLGESYLKMQLWAKARDLFVGVRKFYPQTEFKDLTVTGEAQALYGMGQSEQAMKMLNDLVAQRSKEVWVEDEQNRAIGKGLVTLGRYYAASQNWQESLQAYLKVTTLYYMDSSAVADAQYGSALAFEKLNRMDRAIGQLEEFIKNFPTSSLSADAQKKLESLKLVKKTE